MKILAIFTLVFVLYSPIVLGYGRAKEGKCPAPEESENCAFKLLNSNYDECSGQDFECSGDDKCCDNGCGSYECRPAVGLPPLPVIEASCGAGDQCEAANITYCQENDCTKCCRHNSVCSPSGEHITKDECEKKLCKDILCPGQGEICKLDKYHRAICDCPSECPPDVPNMSVCGSDGETYQNECEMNMTACVTGDRISVVHKGVCQPPRQKSPLEICSLPKDRGHGWTLELNYYFNKEKGICEGFLYHGKGGNENNFNKYKDCTDMCSDTISDVCVLPKLVGPCRAAFPRWHFNNRVQRCERFTYGGCAGNGNNFKSKADCNNQCLCRLPKVKGICYGYFPSWFFNIKTGKCEEFVYGGCRGNMNRFHSKERCEKACGEGEENPIILKSQCLDKSKFNCRSIKKCLPASLKCNGIDDCGDNSDEEGCDPCLNKTCDFYATCVATENNEARCECPIICTADWSPVCGSDNETYPNLCNMKVESCQNQTMITKIRDGECDARVKTKCELERTKQQQRLLVGTYIPQCEEDGRYSEVQCHGSTGYCWCVDGEGNKRLETEIRFDRPNCTGEKEREKSKCEKERDAGFNSLLIGVFVPACEEDGSYSEVQCHSSTGYCWCVDSEGNELPETSERSPNINCTKERPPPTDAPFNICDITLCDFGTCVLVDGNATCLCRKACPLIYAPVCGSNNKTYANLCVMESEACENKQRIEVQYIGKCEPPPTDAPFNICDITLCDFGTCVLVDGNATCRCKKGCPRIYAPVCGSNNKTYANLCVMESEACENKQRIEVQYIGKCGAVDDPCLDFECEFYATCVPLTNGSKVCECPQICTREYEPVCGSDEVTYGNACEMRVTSCEEQTLITIQYEGECDLPPTDAPFNPCDISLCDFGTCVNVNGTATCVCNNACPFIEQPVCGSDNITYANLCVMDAEACERREYINVKHKGPCGKKSKCQKEREKALADRIPGMSVPRCEEDGSYSPKQCVESTAYCWCVSPGGEQIPGTRVRFVEPNCSKVVESDPCADVKCDFYATCVPLDNGDHICDCPRFCTREYEPVCASNGKTYANECEMKVSSCSTLEMLVVESLGECDSQPPTDAPFNPCDISLCDFGTCVNVNGTATCVCNNACPFIEQPVCASDNKTYANLCVMDGEACERKERLYVKFDGPCEEAQPNIIDQCATIRCSYYSQCEIVNGSASCVCEKGCSKELDPKCGSDNITYANPCELRRVSCEEMREINIIKDGECVTPTTTQTTTAQTTAAQTIVATTEALPKCANCPTFGKDNVVKSFCSWYNKFVIIGEILNTSMSGKEISVKVETKFKPTATKTKFTPQNTVNIKVQKPPRCVCDNLEFKKNEKYVLMGRKAKGKKVFVIKWKTGFVEKVSKQLVDKLEKTSQRAKTWALCAVRRSG